MARNIGYYVYELVTGTACAGAATIGAATPGLAASSHIWCSLRKLTSVWSSDVYAVLDLRQSTRQSDRSVLHCFTQGLKVSSPQREGGEHPTSRPSAEGWTSTEIVLGV